MSIKTGNSTRQLDRQENGVGEMAIAWASDSEQARLPALHDEDFDGADTTFSTPVTEAVYGNWKFTSTVATLMSASDASNGLGAILNYDSGTPQDGAMLLNYQADFGVRDYAMASSDGSGFKLESLRIGQVAAGSPTLIVSVYRHGQLVASEAVDLSRSDAGGAIVYTLIDDDINNGRYGELHFNGSAAFDDVDEIRFSFDGDTDLQIDDIDISPAIVDPAPLVASVSVPAAGSYAAGRTLSFTVHFNENVSVTGTDGTLALTIGGAARSAAYASSSADSITYTYTVQAGDMDADGIAIGAIDPGTGTIRDSAGNDADLDLANHLPPTDGVLVDAVAPVVSGSIAVPADDSHAVGRTLRFTVTFDGAIVVSGSDSSLALDIGGVVRHAGFVSSTGNSITYSYTVQTGDNDADGIAVGAIDPGTGTIRDAAGNDANLALGGHLPPTGAVLVDTVAPTLASAAVTGKTLVLGFGDAALLDATHAPDAGAFTVTVDGVAVAVSAVTVDAVNKTVTLTLASAVAHGQAVSLRYADPSMDDDANAIQDAAGNDAATLGPTTVTNHTAPPPTNDSVVDGATVKTTSLIRGDGSSGHVITIDVVTPSRQEQIGDANVADIALLRDAGGAVLLALQVPVGIGLALSGADLPKTAASSLDDLRHEIEAHTASGSADQAQLAGGGAGFLGSLAGSTPLLVQAIVLSADGSNDGTALGIIGQAQAGASARTALVIDASHVTGGAHIALQDVQFAAIIGAASVTGGGGAQQVWGDGASQTVLLGAGDDVLHGGAGNDVLGGGGGNDMIHGDDGDDLVFGSAGDDLLDGGSGNDIARFAGRIDGYSLRVKNGVLVMSDRSGAEGSDTVAAVETLRFGAGQGMADEAVLARLYEGVLQRAASAAELAFWQDQRAHGVSMQDIGRAILASGEGANLHAAQDDQAYVGALYQHVLGRAATNGEAAYWTALLADGTDRAGVALGFVNSAEKLAASVDLDVNHSDIAVLLRMYHAMFGRAPDEAGLNFWLERHEDGMALGEVADAFAASAEADGKLHQGDDGAFIDLVYQSALGHAPTGPEKALLLAQLQQGVFDRGQVLMNVAESAESIDIVGRIDTSIGLV